MGAQGLIAVGVPPQPLWLIYIKGAIVLLSIIVLALGAYALSIFSNDYYLGGGGAGGFDIFIAIFSWIVYGGGAAMEIWAPQHFYRVGSLVSQILAVIFWLTAWAWSADTASAWIKASDLYIYKGSNPLKSFGGALAGCAAIGAVAWILAIVHLTFFIRASVMDSAGSTSQAELGQVKAGEVPQQHYQQPYPPQQQQQYPAQQPYPSQ